VTIPCDEVIAAVGERVDASALSKTSLPTHRDGRLAANPIDGLLQDNLYAIGDAVTGPATAAEAMGIARTCARALDQRLMNRDAFGSLFHRFDYDMTVPESPTATPRCLARQVPPSQRHGNFQEIALGYTGEQARKEASRCLRCDVRENARSPWR
jgi:NADH-quinone oxidoreductase subunit F